jgi:hypothetical protein
MSVEMALPQKTTAPVGCSVEDKRYGQESLVNSLGAHDREWPLWTTSALSRSILAASAGYRCLHVSRAAPLSPRPKERIVCLWLRFFSAGCGVLSCTYSGCHTVQTVIQMSVFDREARLLVQFVFGELTDADDPPSSSQPRPNSASGERTYQSQHHP